MRHKLGNTVASVTSYSVDILSYWRLACTGVGFMHQFPTTLNLRLQSPLLLNPEAVFDTVLQSPSLGYTEPGGPEKPSGNANEQPLARVDFAEYMWQSIASHNSQRSL